MASVEHLLQESIQLHHAGRLLEARSALRKILKKIPAHFDALHFLGLTHVHSQEYDKALPYLKRAQAIRPDQAEVHYNLGVTLYEMQQYEAAIQSLNLAIKLRAGYWKASNLMGNAFALLNLPDQAMDAYQQSIRMLPDCAAAYNGMGKVCADLGQPEQAIRHYQQAIRIDPQLADTHNNLGYALLDAAQPEQAIAVFRQTLLLQPRLMDAYIGMARGLARCGELDESISTYRTAYTIRPDVECALELAEVLQKQKRHQEAICVYETALSRAPDSIEVLNGLGIALTHAMRFDEAITVFRKLLAVQPDNCDALNNLGNCHIEAKQAAQALDCYKAALAITPDFAAAHNGLGNAHKEMGALQLAIDCYWRSLALDPTFAEAYNNLGSVHVELAELEQALEYCQQAVTIKPDYVLAIYNRAVILERLKRYSAAIAEYEHALSIDHEHHDSGWNRSLVQLLLGQYQSGWQGYEQRWKLKEALPLTATPYPRWLGQEDIRGKQLLIQVEQGFGDAIQMGRYIPLLCQQASCTIQCPPALSTLFSRSFPDAVIMDTHESPSSGDYHVPLMSLPLAMQTFSEADIPRAVPYLFADPEQVTFWQKTLASTFSKRVGLVWRGNPKHENDKNRSAKLSDYLALIAAHEHVQFVTLQKDLTTEERDLLAGSGNVRMLDSELVDFDVSAAVLSTLDLLITIDSAPAHLAGALGIPTWILLPANGEWRWLLEREDTPWYPSARLFRQAQPRDWAGVIGRVSEQLGRHPVTFSASQPTQP
ncbi:tetratricopeptide repeat protein [Methylobacillus flagellatus]|uniref:tetratricopeptide repeat protein n=1 Tax=Methylobacillus flagellatus TaxID=405 RepID=UPI0010F52822|nr:tetratricopeptide repeat protein [Methylobacillus flagellatus]